MKDKRAIEIVLELARENITDPRTCDEENAEEMAEEQRTACNVVHDFFVNNVFDGTDVEPVSAPEATVITPQHDYGSGRREAWYHTVEGAVDPTVKGVKSFTGRYLNPGEETRLLVGSLFFGVHPSGSANNGTNEFQLYRVTPGDYHAVGDNLHWQSQFESIRNLVSEEFLCPTEPQQISG